MNDEAPIDLAPLDPALDPARWERLVNATVERAWAARQPAAATLGAVLWAQLAAWARPVLALGPALAAAAWLLALSLGGAAPAPRSEPASSPFGDSAAALDRWSIAEREDSTWELIRDLAVGVGQADDRR